MAAVMGAAFLAPAWAGTAGTTPGHPGAWLSAFLSESPFVELSDAGIALPPTRGDVERLSAVEFLRCQSAIKRVLLARDCRTYAERKRLTDENLLASAHLADELNAPRELALYLRLLASGALGNRRRYMVQSALEQLLRAYLVDELQIRYFVEFATLSDKDLESLWDWLPLASCFNMVSMRPPTGGVQADYLLLKDVYARLHTFYATVQDVESADKVATAALVELALHESTAYTRLYAPASSKARQAPQFSRALEIPASALQKERIRLRENNYFGSLRLRCLDLLLG